MEKSGLFETICDQLYDGVYYVGTDRRIDYWNKSAQKLTGYTSKEVVGTLCDESVLDCVDGEGKSLCTDDCPILKALKDGKRHEAEIFMRHKKGHRVPVLMRAAPVKDKEKRVIGVAEIISDNSASAARHDRVKELERLAMMDELSGLPSRTCLEQALDTRIGELDRYGRVFGVILMDVDHLGELNRKHGREVGDDVLRMIGQTLLYNTRPFDMVGRWDGGTFLGIITDAERKDLAHVAHRFQMLIGTSKLPLKGSRVRVSVSIGATLAKWGDSAEEVLKVAEGMLMESKRSGRNRVSIGG
jgi:diguanylate cyclase (GGDEF)-like protein/PAS domain S-box-containing protein